MERLQGCGIFKEWDKAGKGWGGKFDTETRDWMSGDLNSEPGTALTSYVASGESPSWTFPR